MSLLDSASLIVTPNAYKEGKLYSVIPSDGSGDMSVVRATTATRVNSAGLVELVPYNLLTYSNTFTTNWTLLNATLTSGQSGYNSSTDAWKLQSTGSNNSQIDQGFTQSGTQTFSIYAKKGTANYLVISVFNGGFGWYNLNNGTLGSSGGTFVSRDIISIGGGWYRCTIVTSVAISGAAVYVADADGSTNAANGSNIFIQNSQLNEGTILPYQKTETRLNIPRLDYSNGTCPSLLVEPQRTNLLWYSEQFDNASYWSAYNSTITANTTTAPSGVNTAETLTSNASTGGDVYRLITLNGTYTLSIYLKAGNVSTARIGYSNGDTANFNLANGTYTITGGTSASIEDAGNNWWRCTFTTTITSGTLVSFGNSGTTGTTVFIWGAQLELGSYPTSYIPTTSASVTRNADVISKTGISSLIGQTEGTIFFEGVIYGENPSVNRRILSISNGTTATAINIQTPVLNSKLEFEVTNGGATQVFISAANNSLVYGQNFKAAFAYKANDFVAYINGVQIGTDTNGTVPTCDKLSFDRGNNTSNFEGSAKAAALWQTRLTNDELERLTGTGFNTYAEMANYYNYITQ
jgi:hypothetical protein